MPKTHPATLERIVEPVSRAFTPDFARALIGLRADARVQARMDHLAERCNEGRLTPEEQSEYDSAVAFGTFISILQAKARLFLKRADADG
jgi:hypothetical protein